MIKTIPAIATIAIAAILIGSVFGTTQTLSTANADTIPDDEIDKSFILCAIETGDQLVYPDNALSSGITNEESWTFVLIGEDDLVEATEAQVSAARAHGEVNGQNHEDHTHYDCDASGASAPGPSISVDYGDVVKITLVSDIDNEHIHSIDQHALNGDEHVNSGPIQQGHLKTWVWKSEAAGSYLYHCAGNGLINVWTHINNGMYGNIVVQPQGNDDVPSVEYSVMFADMYLNTPLSGGSGTFDMSSFVAEANLLEVTNGQGFNYAPSIGADMMDGEHTPLPLNPLVVDLDDVGAYLATGDTSFPNSDLSGAPILAPKDLNTRWYITNPGPNQFLAWHFIAGQIDIRDGSTPNKLMTTVANEETWTIPPGSSSISDSTFPSSGLYIGVTHKLSDVVKGGAFAVLACDTDTENGDTDDDLPELLNAVCQTDWNRDGIGGTLDDLNAFNGLVNPKTTVNEI